MIVDTIIDFMKTLPGGQYLGNQYVLAAFLVVLFVIFAKVVVFLFSLYLKRVAQKTKTLFDDLLLEHTKKPIFYLIVFYGFKLALLALQINGTVGKVVNSIISIFLLYVFLRVVDTFIETWGAELAKKTETKIDEVLMPLFQKAAKVVFFVIGFMWVLRIWGIDITPYLAGVGLSGLVLGLALQDTLKNVFGGISVLIDKNFNLGEPVQLESGELGKIKEIGLRSTKLMTFDNELIFIPNGQLANMRIRNYIRPNSKVRKQVDFSVAYGTDVEKVRKLVLSAMKKVKDVYQEPYMDVIFTEMGDSGLHFKARFFADWDNAYSKLLEMTDVIHSALVKAGIEIPYPTRTVYMRKE